MHTPINVGPREVKEKGGKTKTVHEIVHVSKAWKCCSLMQAKICKQEVDAVIKPHDKVFLGHQLEGWQFSGNARKAIRARALKCAREPAIVFDYDHRLVSSQ